ncbi:hypothetical protein [Microbacterium sp.]|uniref:hypothetical protein n=1 Tax=Microbacterium sp. TaxID=51671 RepID=UPI003C7784FF
MPDDAGEVFASDFDDAAGADDPPPCEPLEDEEDEPDEEEDEPDEEDDESDAFFSAARESVR